MNVGKNSRLLGFGEWFEERVDPVKSERFRLARVIAVDRESCVIKDDRGETRAEVAGKLVYGAESPLDFPGTGDWVYARYMDDDSFAVVHEVFPRKSVLKRKTSGKRTEHQLIAANIDTAFVVQSLDSDFSPRRLERYLAMIYDGGIRPVVLLSKSDLPSENAAGEMTDEIRRVAPNVETVAFSNKRDEDVKRVEKLFLPGQTHCLLGSSGVGKTSLVNNLSGEELYEVNAVREWDGKGRHTTTRRQLIFLGNGAMIVDTPGMKELGNIGALAGIEEAFKEIADLANLCRFADCTHAGEKGCAVLAAVEEGGISMEHLQNYAKMKKESAYNELSYLERKKRDKKFGRLCKEVMKNKIKKR